MNANERECWSWGAETQCRVRVDGCGARAVRRKVCEDCGPRPPLGVHRLPRWPFSCFCLVVPEDDGLGLKRFRRSREHALLPSRILFAEGRGSDGCGGGARLSRGSQSRLQSGGCAGDDCQRAGRDGADVSGGRATVAGAELRSKCRRCGSGGVGYAVGPRWRAAAFFSNPNLKPAGTRKRRVSLRYVNRSRGVCRRSGDELQ